MELSMVPAFSSPFPQSLTGSELGSVTPTARYSNCPEAGPDRRTLEQLLLPGLCLNALGYARLYALARSDQRSKLPSKCVGVWLCHRERFSFLIFI